MDDTKNKCRELLKNFSGLEPKEKSNCITLFFSLIEENKKEAKQLYFDFEHLFDSIPELGLVKQELEDACGGELKNPEVTSELSKSFWEIFKSFFENFFTKKRNTNAEVNEYEKNKPSKHFNRIREIIPADLNQTKEVIKTRREIENRLSNLLLNINNAISRQIAIENRIKAYEDNRDNFLANKDFEYEVEEPYGDREEVKQGNYVTVCPKCNYYLCHIDCSYPNNGEKWLCGSMNKQEAFGNYTSIVQFDGKYYLYYGDTPLTGPESCTTLDSKVLMKYEKAKKEGKVKEITEEMIDKIKCGSCEGKCCWKDHRNQSFYYVIRTRKVKRVYDHKKYKLIEAQSKEEKEKKFEEILVDLKKEIEREEDGITCNRNEILKNLGILDKIALRPEKRDEKSVAMYYYELQLEMARKEKNEKRKKDLERIIEKEREFMSIKSKKEENSSYDSKKTAKLNEEIQIETLKK